jgi:hypothetical protein
MYGLPCRVILALESGSSIFSGPFIRNFFGCKIFNQVFQMKFLIFGNTAELDGTLPHLQKIRLNFKVVDGFEWNFFQTKTFAVQKYREDGCIREFLFSFSVVYIVKGEAAVADIMDIADFCVMVFGYSYFAPIDSVAFMHSAFYTTVMIHVGFSLCLPLLNFA